MDEKKIDALFDENRVEESAEFEEELQKRISRVIYLKALKVVLVFSLIIVSCFFGISFMKTTIHYDPFKEEKFLNETPEGGADEFHCLMQTYIEMEYPGRTYLPGDIEKKGFGKYDIKAQIANTMKAFGIGDDYNTIFQLSNSKMTVEQWPGSYLTRRTHEFKNSKEMREDEEYYDFLNYDIDEVKNLPNSAVLEVSISLKEALSIQEYVYMVKKYDYLNPDWIAFGNDFMPGISFGMKTYSVSQYDLNESSKKKYPNIYGEEELSAESLKQQYMSQLQLLLDHKDFVDTLDLGVGSTYHQYQQRYEQAEKHELDVIGIKVSLKKQNLLDFIEKENVEYLQISDVRLSVYQYYN